MWIFLSLNQNRVRVKSVQGKIVLAVDPLYILGTLFFVSYLFYLSFKFQSDVRACMASGVFWLKMASGAAPQRESLLRPRKWVERLHPQEWRPHVYLLVNVITYLRKKEQGFYTVNVEAINLFLSLDRTFPVHLFYLLYMQETGWFKHYRFSAVNRNFSSPHV